MEFRESIENKAKGENALESPVLVDRFYDVKEIPNIDPGAEDFEPVLDRESFRRHLFEQSRKAFLFVLDDEKMRRSLSTSEPTEEAFAYLKQVRQFGLILRGNYKFSDSSHTSPEDLYRFLSLLGGYNDRYWLRKKEDPALLLETFDRMRKLDLTFDSASNSSFEEYAKKILNDTRTRMQKTELPAREFHKMRKRIRLFANLMQVAAAEDYGGNMHWLFSSVLSISRRLGKQHDELVQKDLRKKIDYESAMIQIEPDIRQDFERLEPYLEKVTGISKE